MEVRAAVAHSKILSDIMIATLCAVLVVESTVQRKSNQHGLD